MPAYDSNLFDPPGPVASITLRSIQDGKIVRDVPMLLDSGSDLTVIPETSINELGLDPTLGQRVELAGFDGHTSAANSVELDLIFLGLTFRGRLPAVNSPIGILGRNVLNRFAILLDGPGLNWKELTDQST